MYLRLKHFILIAFGFIYLEYDAQEVKATQAYREHVQTLEFIAGKTDNNKRYLDMALAYCDSIQGVNPSSEFAKTHRKSIELTLSTCADNMNFRVELFPFLCGIPTFFGFADDGISYAYDDALNSLFETMHTGIFEGPLKDANIKSILTKGACDNEMFDVIKQSILSNTNHDLINYEEIISLVGKENADRIIESKYTDSLLKDLCEKLQVSKIGIFYANNLDNIKDKLFYVETGFRTFSLDNGLDDPVLTKGFREEKSQSLSFIPWLVLESILLIALLSFMEEQIYRLRKSRNNFSIIESLRLFGSKISFTIKCFIIPAIFSFVMLQLVSFIIPEAGDHYLEFSAVLWLVLLTIGLSVIPTVLNLFVINRFKIDGFHTYRGYRNFANASIYASYLPLFVFYLVYYDTFPRESHILLIIFSFTIGDLLASTYYNFNSNLQFRNLKSYNIIGIGIGILSLIVFNSMILTDLSASNMYISLFYILPFVILYRLSGFLLNYINQKTQVNEETSHLNEVSYVESVLGKTKIFFDKVANLSSKDSLYIGIINAPKGMGKTRLLKVEAKKEFEAHDWHVYYGDCDEIQDENTPSYEPFLQAFQQLLKVDSFTNRSNSVDESIGNTVIDFIDNVSPVSSFIPDHDSSSQGSMVDIAIEIAEKLERKKHKILFILEDLHWIDPESYAFLKTFVKVANRSTFLRKNMAILISIRSHKYGTLRGVNSEKIMDEFNSFYSEEELLQSSNKKLEIDFLLDKSQFNVKDFVLNLIDVSDKFKIQKDSAYIMNDLFNQEIQALKKDENHFELTPRYILMVIEKWIIDRTLTHTVEGYVLSRTINTHDLPNSDEINSYYHSIFSSYENKWNRLLESAASIGHKFNAEVLANVWGMELLDVLSFLETAETDGLVIDLNDQDNLYEFKDKRVAGAIKDYFGNSKSSETKQIVIEYNKRFLQLQKQILQHPDQYSVEECMIVARRCVALIKNRDFDLHSTHIFASILIRLIDEEKHQEIEGFANYIAEKGNQNLANIIKFINIISNQETSFTNILKYGKEIYAFEPQDDIEKELKILGLLKKDKHFEEEHDYDYLLNTNDIEYLRNRISTRYKEVSMLTATSWLLKNIELELSQKNDFIQTNIQRNNSPLITLELEFLRLFLNQNEYSKDELEEKSFQIYEHSLVLKNRRFIGKTLNFYLEVLSNKVDKKEEAVELFIIDHEKLKTGKITKEWVDVVLSTINMHAGKILISKYPEFVAENLDFIEKYIYARHDQFDFNHLINQYIHARLKYFEEMKMHEPILTICMEYLKTIELSVGKNHGYYADMLVHLANYYQIKEEYPKMIETRLEQLQIFEKLYEINPVKYRRHIRIAHNNLALRYRNRMNDLKNAIIHSEKALKYASPNEGAPYGIAHYQLAKVYQLDENFSKACELYAIAAPFFNDGSSSQLFKKRLLEVNWAYSKFMLNEKNSLKELQNAIKNIQSKEIALYMTPEVENFIKQAEMAIRK